MPHDFIIEGMGVSTDVITAGSSSVVEFTAPSEGTYAYYCSVGNHRGMGMEGSLIVNPAS
jgi:plastocyanin